MNMKTNICVMLYPFLGSPGGSDSKESACNMGDLGSIPQWGRCPGEGNGAWWATVQGVAKSWTRLSI